MTIVVEDGSNVLNANSYADVAELGIFATERGITLPADDLEKEVLLIKAMDYLETLESRFFGYRTYTDQTLSFPRYYNYADVLVPANLKKAQMVLATTAMFMDLIPAQAAATARANRKTVGPITVEYETSASSRASIPQVDALLESLFGGFPGQLRVIRA